MASQRKKGVVLSYIFMGLEVFSSIFFTPFLIRSFGQSEYGVYSLVASITSYLYLFDLGIGNSIIRYMSKYRIGNEREKQGALMSVTLIFYAMMCALIIIIGIFINSHFQLIFSRGLSASEISNAKVMFTITVINAGLTLMFAPFNKTNIAFEKFTFSKVSDITKIIFRVSVSIVILKMGGKGVSIVTVNLCMTILFGLVSAWYTIFKLKVKPLIGRIDKEFIKNIFSYSFIVFIQMIATQLNSMVDQLLMGIMIASSSVIIGIYAIGAQICTYLQSIASSINGVLMPGVVRMMETTKDVNIVEKEMIRISRLAFMLLALIYIVFVIYGDDFICLWAGEQNFQAYYVAVIIMFPMVLQLSQSIGSQILWAINRHKVQAVLQISVALSNVLFTAILINWNPIIGASIATAITYFVGNVVVYNIIFSKYIGISMLSYYKGVLKGIAPALCISFVIGFMFQYVDLQGWIGFCINSAVMIIVYCMYMYFRGSTTYERNLVYSVIKKLFKISQKQL